MSALRALSHTRQPAALMALFTVASRTDKSVGPAQPGEILTARLPIPNLSRN